MERQIHSSLPQHLSFEELQVWIMRASVERFKDKTKRYFAPEELQEFEHESSRNGRHKNKLESILQAVTELIRKGNDKEMVITIPETVGTQNCDKFRRQNDDLIEAGFEEVDCEVFGIVNNRDETIEYFTLDGSCITERTRSLSMKEKQQYLVVNHMASTNSGAKLIIDESVRKEGTNN